MQLMSCMDLRLFDLDANNRIAFDSLSLVALLLHGHGALATIENGGEFTRVDGVP